MDRQKALDRMMALCSRREYAPMDVEAKLRRLEMGGEDIKYIIDYLCREGFVDVRRYAAAFVHDKSAFAGWGPLKLRRALASKGISGEIISASLEGMDEDVSRGKLESLIRGKMKQLSDTEEPVRRMKVLRFALGRGYGYDQILETYDNIRTT